MGAGSSISKRYTSGRRGTLDGDVPAPPHPAEANRLQTLYTQAILDTPATEAFDRITKMASSTLGMPIALVSLIDKDRQWFKSKQGPVGMETPRSSSFCAHTILVKKGEVFVVEDAHENEIFANNRLVTGAPFIRFYAGSPVHAYNGLPLGTLCIIDHKPRTLSKQQKQTLQMLAKQVEEQLVLEHHQRQRLNDKLEASQHTQQKPRAWGDDQKLQDAATATTVKMIENSAVESMQQLPPRTPQQPVHADVPPPALAHIPNNVTTRRRPLHPTTGTGARTHPHSDSCSGSRRSSGGQRDYSSTGQTASYTTSASSSASTTSVSASMSEHASLQRKFGGLHLNLNPALRRQGSNDRVRRGSNRRWGSIPSTSTAKHSTSTALQSKKSSCASAKISQGGTLYIGDFGLNTQGMVAGQHRSKRPLQPATAEIKLRVGHGASGPVTMRTTIGATDMTFISSLGHGGSGVVSKCLCKPLFLLVAVKQVSIESGSKSQVAAELAAFMRIDHPFLVGFIGAYFHEYRVHLILEYMNRGSVRQYVTAKAGKLSEAEVKSVAHQVVQGLVYLHSKMILHCDLKPSNMLINAAGVVKISDFGLTKELNKLQHAKREETGTLQYLSPERINQGVLSLPSDVWSFGISLIFCATGSVPLPNEYWALTACLQPENESPSIPDSHSFSPSLREFVSKCVAWQPSARYTADALLGHTWFGDVLEAGAVLKDDWNRTDDSDRARVLHQLALSYRGTSKSPSNLEFSEVARACFCSEAEVRENYPLYVSAVAKHHPTKDPASQNTFESVFSPRPQVPSMEPRPGPATALESVFSPRPVQLQAVIPPARVRQLAHHKYLSEGNSVTASPSLSRHNIPSVSRIPSLPLNVLSASLSRPVSALSGRGVHACTSGRSSHRAAAHAESTRLQPSEAEHRGRKQSDSIRQQKGQQGSIRQTEQRVSHSSSSSSDGSSDLARGLDASVLSRGPRRASIATPRDNRPVWGSPSQGQASQRSKLSTGPGAYSTTHVHSLRAQPSPLRSSKMTPRSVPTTFPRV